MPTKNPHGAFRSILSAARILAAASVLAAAFAPAPARAQGEECNLNLSFTLDAPTLGEVVDHFVTVRSSWGNLYLLVRRGGDTWFLARAARSVIDNNPATSPVFTRLDSIQISSPSPPVALDLLEVQEGVWNDDFALLALGSAGVGAIEADGNTLSSGTIDIVDLPGITWDVKGLTFTTQLAHVYTASGTSGLHLLDLNSAGGELELLDSFPISGDSRAVEVYVTGPDTMVVVAKGNGLQVVRSDATRPGGFDTQGATPSAAVLDTREQRMLFLPGAEFTDMSAWALDLARQRWEFLPATGPFPASRLGHAAMYDSLNNRLVMYGGGPFISFGGDSLFFANPWSLDLGTLAWEYLAPTVGPPDGNPRRNAAVVLDPDRNRFVVFGGDRIREFEFNPLDIRFRYEGQTWAFDLGTRAWSDLTPASPDSTPSKRSGMASVFLPGNANRPDRMLIHGGKYGFDVPDTTTTGVIVYRDYWIFDLEADRWYRPLTSGVPPRALANHRAFYDPENDRVFVFGDTLGSGSPQPGTIYTLALADSAPQPGDLLGEWTASPPPFIEFPPRIYFSGVYDATRDGVLVAGGLDSAQFYADLNFLDGSDLGWSRVFPEILTHVDSLVTGGSAEDVARWGDTLFVAEGLKGISVVHAGAVLDPSGADTVFAVVDTLAVEGYAHGVRVEGNYLYVSARTGGVQVFSAARPDTGLVARYRGLGKVETIEAVGWNQHPLVPLGATQAFAFVADQNAFTVLHHEAVDLTAPGIALAPVEKGGLPGRFSTYAVVTECLQDTLFADDGIRSRYVYSYLDTAGTVVRDSTAYEFAPVVALDAEERLYATSALFDIRDGIEAVAGLHPGLIADSLRLEFSWQARDLVGNQGTGSERIAVGSILGEIGGALRAMDPAIRLQVPSGSFAGRGQFYFLEEHRLDQGEAAVRPAMSGLLMRYPDPGAQGLEIAGASCRVGWTVAAGAAFELVLPLSPAGAAQDGPGPAEGVAIYRLEGDRWIALGSRTAGGEVRAAVDRPGVYAALRGATGGPGTAPLAAGLEQNAPNPFNPYTVIRYRLPEAAQASLRIYDVQGRVVRTLVEGPLAAGEGIAAWDGKDDAGRGVTAGVYFYRLETERGENASRKMILAR